MLPKMEREVNKLSAEITIEMKPFDKRVARTNYHVEFYFDDKSKIDIRERMKRVIRHPIEDDSLKNEVLS